MTYLIIDPQTMAIAEAPEAESSDLAALVKDDDIEDVLIGGGYAIIVGESSLLRPGMPFLEFGSLEQTDITELVRGIAILAGVDEAGELVSLSKTENGIAKARKYIEENVKRWYPFKVDESIYLKSDNGDEVRKHPILNYCAFGPEDFVK